MNKMGVVWVKIDPIYETADYVFLPVAALAGVCAKYVQLDRARLQFDSAVTAVQTRDIFRATVYSAEWEGNHDIGAELKNGGTSYLTMSATLEDSLSTTIGQYTTGPTFDFYHDSVWWEYTSAQNTWTHASIGFDILEKWAAFIDHPNKGDELLARLTYDNFYNIFGR